MMKFKNIILLSIISILLFSSCKETPIEIGKLGPKDVGAKRVLLEEFTGVRCVACPTGHVEIANLKALYGENIIAVGVHSSDFFAEPYPESQYDFRTEDGTSLFEEYAQGVAFPASLINRTHFDGEFDFAVNPSNKWAAHVADELEKPVDVEVSATVEYHEDSHSIYVHFSAVPQVQISEELTYVILLVENNIVDAQLTPDEGVITNYVHQDVLRDYLTDINGVSMGSGFSAGELFTADLSYDLDNLWNADNCELVAFVLNSSTGVVMQAFSTHIKE